MNIADILANYASSSPDATRLENVESHFDQAVQQVEPQGVGTGIAAALRSDATPSFGQSVGTMFDHSDPVQKAGVVNHLIQALGSGALSGIAGQLLGKVLGSTPVGTTPTISPAQASQLSPSDVSTIATHAQGQDDSVVDRLAGFYAQHPALVKTIGAAGLAIALSRMRSA